MIRLGNGMLKCDENKEEIDNVWFHYKKTFEVLIIKLSDFILFLANKNKILIKLVLVENEILVIQDAVEFNTNYHIPYIYSVFSKNMIIHMKIIKENS